MEFEGLNLVVGLVTVIPVYGYIEKKSVVKGTEHTFLCLFLVVSVVVFLSRCL